MTKPSRRNYLMRRRARKRKLKLLKKKYAEARSEDRRKEILAKFIKIAPWLSREEFVGSLKK